MKRGVTNDEIFKYFVVPSDNKFSINNQHTRERNFIYMFKIEMILEILKVHSPGDWKLINVPL